MCARAVVEVEKAGSKGRKERDKVKRIRGRC